MSQENVQIVASIYGEFAMREEGLALIHPDVVIRQDPAVVGTERTYHWHEGFVQSILDIGAALDDTARGRESGIEVRQVVGHVWTLRAGLVVRVEAYASAAEAFEAVCLPEK